MTTSRGHAIMDQVAAVEATHKGLGRTATAITVASLAGRFVFTVAPAGTGKSTISDAIESAIPNTVRFDSVTRAGLARRAEELSGFDAALIIDDVGRIENKYLMENMLVSLVELCYGHTINKDSGLFNFEIHGFNGAVIANIQPIILKSLVTLNQWESNLADKSLRFYHLVRPLVPSIVDIKVVIKPRVPLDKVTFIEQDIPEWVNLIQLGMTQWGRTRVKEHLIAMLKVVASCDGQEVVRPLDMKALNWLLRPMSIERYILHRKGFESGRSLNTELLHLLTAFITYHSVTLDVLVADYKLSPSTIYDIMERQDKYTKITAKNPTIWEPSDIAMEILREAGYAWTNVSQGS